MPVTGEVADRVKNLRRALGLKQPAFAAEIGVSPVTVSRWENGHNEPDDFAWSRLAALEAGLEAPALKARRGIPDVPPALDFGGDPVRLAAVAEASRLSYGHLASPTFATEISLIDPLPHQRVAVYDHMLGVWPLRFLLADDAGAGKTIMAGLTIRELLSRRLVRRVLVVCPAGLVGNWRRELRNLFRIPARAVRGAEAARGNPFFGKEGDFVVVSVDTLRSKGMFARLREAGLAGQGYDLAIFDEAHKLSAHRDDADMRIEKTARYRLAEALAGIETDDEEFRLGWKPQGLLLLTATPHQGKNYPYFALWRLLDPDVFTTPDTLADLTTERRARYFIRRTKEEMVRVDGSPLYPPRVCDTLGFDLGPAEWELYERTSRYIRDAYNKASSLNRSAARLAMSVFQRRLASSTYALLRSFERRIERLDAAIRRVEEGGSEALRRDQDGLERKARKGDLDLFESRTADEDEDEEGAEVEAHEAGEAEALGATVTEELTDLLLERAEVVELRDMARALVVRGEESKFARLLELMDRPEFRGEKMLVFTEHRDTANWLTQRLEARGHTGQVAQLHGAMDWTERDAQVELFRTPTVEGGAQYLIATDAAGEGVNLQFCWLMVNYDVPWNPARLEQRMGRIHRYGQQKDSVHIANLVAPRTREGKVLQTLLTKMEEIRKALRSDKVFDVIGRLFEGVSLASYFEAAVRGGDRVAELGGVLTKEQVEALGERERRVYGDGGDVKSRLPALRDALDKEQYLRLR